MQQCKRLNVPRLGAVAAAVMALGYMGHVGAFEIETGSDNVKMRLDNKVSATLGVRTKERNSFVTNSSLNSAATSEFFADKGELYTARVDLYSEFDLKYKNDHGIRLSAAAWGDPLFPSKPRTDPAVGPYNPWGQTGNFTPDQQWSSNTKRYYRAGAELLDAFAFTRFELADTPINVKLGRTSVVWGEANFGQAGGINSIGYAQNPNDGRKGSQNPNASPKETSLPLAQVHVVANITDTSNLSVYKALEWRPDRVPASGTYMGFADGIAGAPNLFCAPQPVTFTPFCLPYAEPFKGKRGDWGVQYKFRPSFYSGNIALAYREFAEKSPWYAVWDPNTNALGGGAARSVYGNDTKMFGLTTNLTAYDISWGAELNYRKNAALVSDFSALATGGAGGLNNTVTGTEGARGDTLHAVFNGTLFAGKALFWDTFVIVGEIAHARLQKVTKNADLYQAVGASYAPVVCNLPAAFGGSPNRKVAGCADKSSTAVGVFLDPTTYQVFPSVDLDIPVFLQHNFGNSPLNGGTADGTTTISAGLKFTVAAASGPQTFQINYLGFRGKSTTVNGSGHNILGAPYQARDQVQLTYNSSF